MKDLSIKKLRTKIRNEGNKIEGDKSSGLNNLVFIMSIFDFQEKNIDCFLKGLYNLLLLNIGRHCSGSPQMILSTGSIVYIRYY